MNFSLLHCILFYIAGMLLGPCISHYTAITINKSPDCVKQIEHKIFGLRNIIVCLINGLLWAMIYISCGINIVSIIYMIVASSLLALSVVDLAIYEIPIEFNIIILVAAVVVVLLDLNKWYEYAIGSILVSGLFWIISLVTKGKGMGGGDIKLMFTCGLLLGWKKIFFVMFLGSLLGSIIHISMMKLSGKEKVLAFGPYLSAAAFFMMCYGNMLVEWYINTFLNFKNF